MTEDGPRLRTTNDLKDRLSRVKQSVVLCGHDHTPRTVSLPNGKLIVNPGSVGLQAYSDDQPYPHVVETGAPHARYSIISDCEGSWQVEEEAVPYEWDIAAAVAENNGRHDWATWLRTGRADFS